MCTATELDHHEDLQDDPRPTGQPRFRVQQVITQFGPEYLRTIPDRRTRKQAEKVLTDLMACRTHALGGHRLQCPDCGHELNVYNQCQNRSCPTCQAMERERWIEQRMARMLPIGHFHVVFTLPAELRELAFRNPERVTYRMLHQAAAEALQGLADEQLHARLGITIVLHTWSRAMIFHPHVHCIVSAGGLRRDQQHWVPTRPDFLFSLEVLRDRFRDLFLQKLRRQHQLQPLTLTGCDGWQDPEAFAQRCEQLAATDWIAYIEPPFTDAAALTRYLGQYTHRIAISDWRILDVTAQTVRIATRDGDSLELTGFEFLRRFLLHVPPVRACRIRHYGLYSAYGVTHWLAHAWALVAPNQTPPTVHRDEPWDVRLERVLGHHPWQCPQCGRARMVSVKFLFPHSYFAPRLAWQFRRWLAEHPPS